MNNMDMVIFGGYTLKQLLIYGGGAVAVLVVIVLLKKLMKPEKSDPHFQIVRCSNCGWAGKVSRYAGKCPGCNKPLGDRKTGNPQ